jgi:predicted HicB family RNase H-like nuclease
MPVSKKQQASVHKYVREKYDRLELTMPKGKKADLQAHAAARSESLNGFVNRAIDETVERDNCALPADAGSGVE